MGILTIIIAVLAVAVVGLAMIRIPGMTCQVLTGAAMLGGIGFALGFFGPMLLTPQSNQGPLLGIFVTGPLGVVIGAIGGALVAWQRVRRLRESNLF